MHKLILALTAFSCIFITGCSSYDINRDYDPAFNFTSLKNYTLREGLGVTVDKNTLIGQRLINAVHKELQSKGFNYVESKKSADFVVALEYWERQYVEPGRVSIGVGVESGYPRSYGGWGLGYGVPRVREQDTLAIRIYNAETNKEIWQGSATGNLDRKDPQKTTEVIGEAISEILEKFVPSSETNT